MLCRTLSKINTAVWSLWLSLLQVPCGKLRLVHPMTIRTNSLIELLKTFPGDATVRGFDEGLTVMNGDGAGRVVILNDTLHVSATYPTHAHKLWIARKSV